MSVYTDPLPTLASGELPDPDKWADILLALGALYDAPTAYTPIWTGSSTNAVLGNSVLTGEYSQLGKIVFVRIRLFIGNSGVTIATGVWRFTLPVAPVADQVIAALFNDASLVTRFAGQCWLINGLATGDNMRIVYSGESGFANQTNALPVAAAAGDTLILQGRYTAQ